MSILDYFRSTKHRPSAAIAKERLQIIVAHERGQRTDYLPLLQKELLEVIAKYVNIEQENVKVELERSGDYSVLELNITLPSESTIGSQEETV
jgi:cell division topological specificity factor